MPSPEHGASTKTTSKQSITLEKASGESLETKTLSTPHFPKFSARILLRWRLISFASTTEFRGNASNIALVFPPGAAQRSNTRAPSGKLSCLINSEITIEAASCA